jgi:hypothetical protein
MSWRSWTPLGPSARPSTATWRGRPERLVRRHPSRAHAGAGPVRAPGQGHRHRRLPVGAGARAAGHVRRARAGCLGERTDGQAAGGRGGAQPRRRPAVPPVHRQGDAQRQSGSCPGLVADDRRYRRARGAAPDPCADVTGAPDRRPGRGRGANRYAAGRIPGARLVELPDGDNLPFVGTPRRLPPRSRSSSPVPGPHRCRIGSCHHPARLGCFSGPATPAPQQPG